MGFWLQNLLVINSCLNIAICMSISCPKGEYYEAFLERCEKCSMMCEDARIRGNVKACEEVCPGYLERDKLEGTTIHTGGILTTSAPNIENSKDDFISGTRKWVTVAFLGGVAVGIFVVGLIWFLKRLYDEKKRGKESHSISLISPTNNDNEKKKTRGIQESQLPSSVHPCSASLLEAEATNLHHDTH